MQTKKILIIPLLSVLGATSFASYIVQYPEQPIVFKDLGTWVANDPVVTTWLNVGTPMIVRMPAHLRILSNWVLPM